MKKLFFALLFALQAAALCTACIRAYADETAPAVIKGGVYIKASGNESKALPEQSGYAEQTAKTAGPDLSRIALPEDAELLITVEGGRNEDKGILRLMKKNDARDGAPRWDMILSASAALGKKGLYKEKEGDLRTPVGVFRMNTPFGIGDPLPGFPENYLKIDSSCYWVGDSSSPRYNTLVNIKGYAEFDTQASEHLTDYAGYYNYAIDTGYNSERTPYKGSAIFLHCAAGEENTHGCIAVPEQDMTEIMKNYQEGRTYIVIYDRENTEAVYR